MMYRVVQREYSFFFEQEIVFILRANIASLADAINSAQQRIQSGRNVVVMDDSNQVVWENERILS